MPIQTQEAVNWALTQKIVYEWGEEFQITANTPHYIVDFVRKYFNENAIEYGAFSFSDLESFL